MLVTAMDSAIKSDRLFRLESDTSTLSFGRNDRRDNDGIDQSDLGCAAAGSFLVGSSKNAMLSTM